MPKRRKPNIDNKENAMPIKKTFVRYQEGADLYSVGLHTFQEWAKDANAIYRVKGVILVNTNIIDEFLETFREQ